MAYSAINERNKNITSKRRKNIKLLKDTLAELLLGKGERRVSRSKSRSKSET